MSVPDAELRDLIRTLVIAALQRLEAESSREGQTRGTPSATGTQSASSKRILLLFMARDPVTDDFFSQITALTAQGYGFIAAFSRTFEQFQTADDVLKRLPSGTKRLAADAGEAEITAAGKGSVALIAPTVSSGTAAKVTQGIDDSLPSLLIREALLAERPVLIARDLPQLERELTSGYPAAPQALLRATVDAYHRLRAMGVRFLPAGRTAAEISALFHQPVNETPARLARTKPSTKRVFITAEDVWNAVSEGRKELTHPQDAVVTDAAREEAAARGVALIPG